MRACVGAWVRARIAANGRRSDPEDQTARPPTQTPARDEHRGFQLYQSDPSGNYGGWKAACIGANHQAATNVLQGDYQEDVDLEQVWGRAACACTRAHLCL